MVEFSILMIVMVPLLTYGFYLMDLGHHLLDVQETVISTTWDYTSATYEADQSKGALTTNLSNIYHANRFEYIDHSSAYDDFSDLKSSSDEKKYHYEFGSRASWVTKGSSGAGASDPMASQSTFNSDYSGTDAAQVKCALDHSGDLSWLVSTAGINLRRSLEAAITTAVAW